jgi:hypothetical protein
MPTATVNRISNERLNDLLIDVGRSLLQYTSEAWPWASSNDEHMRDTIERMAEEQRSVITALVELLADRGHAIELGAYPTEYTSLHYVAIDFLLGQLIANQRSVLAACEAVERAAAEDDEARALLQDIVLSERGHLEELQAIESRRQNSSAP